VTRVPRPGPPPNPVTAPFWAALAEGRLLLQRCARCGHVQHHPRPLCTSCWAPAPEWVASAGGGSVWTWTVVHRAGHPGWADAVPYAVVVVELDEGPRLVTAWSGDLGDLALGRRVRVGGREEDGHHVLVAAPAGDP
jgi:uncharacterized OB-fold protein